MRVVSEGPVRITKATVEAAWRRRAPGERLIVRDMACRGLALVVNPTGMAWTFSYRPRGTDPATGRRWPNRSITLGTPASHSPDDARDEAGAHKGRVKGGADPAADRKARAVAANAARARTFSRLLEDYAQALPTRPMLRGAGLVSARHAAEELAHAGAAVEMMGAAELPVAGVTLADVRRLVLADAARPATARHRFGALSRFFDWCQDEGHIAANPCNMLARSRRPKPPAARRHFLAADALARLWKAAGEGRGLAPVHRDLIRFLIAIPCRRGEARRMEWQQVDLRAGVWAQPAKRTKNGEPHRLYLHPLVLALLRERHAEAGEPKAGLVFPAPLSGKAVDTFTDMKAALVDATGIEGWQWHDFRRSFVTALGERGIPEPVADAVLNHRQTATRGGVLGVYQQAQRWPEQVRAMQLWGEVLAAALDGREPGAEVVPLATHRV